MGSLETSSTEQEIPGASPKTGKVAVIVPAYNASHCITQLLVALDKQIRMHDAILVIVDNNSKDNTASLAKSFLASTPFKWQVVHHPRPSSYSARNCGISHAPEAEIYAFIDADCVPGPDWLSVGIQDIEAAGGDLLAGNIQFQFPSPITSAHIVDSITNLGNQEESVSNGHSRTANLFVRNKVFKQLGTFDSTAISGEDLCWTKGATNAGMRLVYSPGAFVYHPARGFRALLKKQYRVGMGKNKVLAAQGYSPGRILAKTLLSLWLPKWKLIRPRIKCISVEEAEKRRISILWTVWVMRVATALGQLHALLRKQ